MALILETLDKEDIPEELKRRLAGKLKKISKSNVSYVYFLYDKKRCDFVYVGQTINLEDRIQNHKQDKFFTDVYVFQTKEANKWETYWQKKLVPIHCNDTHLKKHKIRRKENSIKKYNLIIHNVLNKMERKQNDTSKQSKG